MMFTIGIGNNGVLPLSATYRYSGIRRNPAAAMAVAIDTESTAFAPSRCLVGLRVVLEKRLRDEESGRVDEQCRVAVMLGKLALHIGDSGAICQLGGDAPGFARPAHQLSDGVVDTGFRASDDHRAAAVIDDVDRGLPADAGAAADNNDLLGLKMHIRGPFLVLLTAPTGPRFFVSTTRRIRGCRRIRAWTCGWAG
jgi:hypothetical protein